MPRRNKRSKFVTKRGLPFLLMKTAETKHHTQVAADVSLVSSLPIELDMTDVDQGDSVSQKIGQELQISSVFFKCGFSNSLDDTSPTNKAYYGRVILYTPRDPLDLIDAQPFDFPDRQKFIIWADKTVPIPWVNSVSNSMVTIKKRFKPYMKAIYDSGGGTSCIKGKLLIQISTNSPTALVECSYGGRMYFKDL